MIIMNIVMMIIVNQLILIMINDLIIQLCVMYFILFKCGHILYYIL